MTESFLYVLSSSVLAVVLAYALIGPLGTFLFRTIEFRVFTDYQFLAWMASTIVATGLLAGIYPSLVLSGYSPISSFQAARGEGGAGHVRQVLSIAQFAILTGLMVAAYVIYSQARFGIGEALRDSTDPIVIVNTTCIEPLKHALLQTPGVKDVACSNTIPQWGVGPGSGIAVRSRPQASTSVRYTSLGVGFLELYGLEPVAGRFFSEEKASDIAPKENVWAIPEAIVINETTAKHLGFDSPRDAVGQILAWGRLFRLPNIFTPYHDAQVIGVVEDFQIGSVSDYIRDVVFYVDRGQQRLMGVKIDKENIAATLKSIDKAWAKFVPTGPIQRFFFHESIGNMYRVVTRQAQLLGIYTGIAIFIAVLGLIGLASFVAERRTKEIGIRKVLGGSRTNIICLLLWQFLKPVLLSNLVAWPIAYYYLSLWLEEFQRHIQLHLWMFVGSGMSTLIFAVGTVFLHAYVTAGLKPVSALRYE